MRLIFVSGLSGAGKSVTGPNAVAAEPKDSRIQDPVFSRVPHDEARVVPYDVKATDQVVPG